MMGVTRGVGTVSPFGATDSTPPPPHTFLSEVSVAQSLVFCVVYHCLSFVLFCQMVIVSSVVYMWLQSST
jgi:hypothetical protein